MSQNGKGSKRRPCSAKDFAERWDSIDWKGDKNKSWLVSYKRDNDILNCFVTLDGEEKDVKKYLKKNSPWMKIIKIEEDWTLQISREIAKIGGEMEDKLRNKCRWEQRTRTSIILEYGDPRLWK